MLKRLRVKGRRFRRDEGGYSSAEFVVVLTTFMTGFAWVFESGTINIRQMMLDRAVDLVVRDLRLYNNPNYSHDFMKAEICRYAYVFQNCDQRLFLDLQPVNLATGYTKTYSCYDKENDVNPITTWNRGARQEIVYMRACIIVDPMMPNGVALFPNVQATGVPLVSDTAFMNEPA
ncbi:MAG: hypothetical protein AAF761_05110 [Pseudomonadota bacterium]